MKFGRKIPTILYQGDKMKHLPYEKRRNPWEFGSKKKKAEEIRKELNKENYDIWSKIADRKAPKKYRELQELFKELELEFDVPVDLVKYECSFELGEEYLHKTYLLDKGMAGIWQHFYYITHKTGYNRKWKLIEVPDNPLSRVLHNFSDKDILLEKNGMVTLWRKI